MRPLVGRSRAPPYTKYHDTLDSGSDKITFGQEGQEMRMLESPCNQWVVAQSAIAPEKI